MTNAEIEKGVAFHDGLANAWSRNYQRGGFKRRLALVRQILSRVVVPGEHWLDAGCGAGLLTREMSALGATGLAVDGSQHMIDAAVRDTGVMAGFAFRRVGSVTSLNMPEATFDGVLCSSVIEYVGDVEKTVGEFHRVLKPGGKLVVSAPNRYSAIRHSQKWLRSSGAWLGLDLFQYLSVSVHDFTKGGLLDLLKESGFSVLTLHRFDPIPPGPFRPLLPPALYFAVATKARPSPSVRSDSEH